MLLSAVHVGAGHSEADIKNLMAGGADKEPLQPGRSASEHGVKAILIPAGRADAKLPVHFHRGDRVRHTYSPLQNDKNPWPILAKAGRPSQRNWGKARPQSGGLNG